MDSVVVDTDVLSYLFKQDSRGESYRAHLEGKLGVISFMTIAELDFWANMRNWGAQRRAQLATFLEPYAVIDSDRELAYTWAAIRSEVMRSGRHIDTADCWIAATARLHGIPLLTNNHSHFLHISGLTTISEQIKT
jgi:predicted nucleic acid-binding protein